MATITYQGPIQFRNGTASAWTTANPVLLAGEMGVETDTNKFKIGDGVQTWSALAYGGLVGPAVPLSNATPAALGSAAPGVSTNASRSDHVHAMPTAAQVGAPAGSGTSSGANTGDVTLGAVGASPNANGASLAGQVLTLQPASASQPGALTAAGFNALAAAVPNTRTVSAGTGLTGGGNLSADRTIGMADMAANTVKANPTAATAAPADTALGPNTVLGRIGGNIAALAIATTLTAALGTATAGAAPTQGALSGADKNALEALQTSYAVLTNQTFTGGAAIGNGVVSAVSAVTAAVASLPAAGGVIVVPPGNFDMPTGGTQAYTLAKGGVRFMGLNKNNCTFTTSSGTGDIFLINEWFCGFENISFNASVTRTAGYAINAPVGYNYLLIRQCRITNHFHGVLLGNVLAEIDGLDIRLPLGASVGVTVTGTSDRYINNYRYDNVVSFPVGSMALRVKQCGSLILTNSNLIHADTAWMVDPDDGATVPSIEATNFFCDNSGDGMTLTRTGTTGAVFRCKLTNGWFSSCARNGLWVNSTTVDGITLANCDFYQNVRGAYLQSFSEVTIGLSRFGQNSTAGIEAIGGGIGQLKVEGCSIGPMAAFTANGTGVILSGSFAAITILSNDLRGNTNGPLNDTSTLVAGAGQCQIQNNLGLLVAPQPVIAVQALPLTTVTRLGDPFTCPAFANRPKSSGKISATIYKTAATASTLTLTLRNGTTNSNTDAAIATLALGAGTAATGACTVEAEFIYVSATTAFAFITVFNNAAVGVTNAALQAATTVGAIAVTNVNTLNYWGLYGSLATAANMSVGAVKYEVLQQ